jgi:hypothetical protein
MAMMRIALKGHDFSRADVADKDDGALAPEGRFSADYGISRSQS